MLITPNEREATDINLTLHQNLTSVDGVCTQDLQLLMQVVVKTRSGQVLRSQLDTLFKQHCCSSGRVKLNSQTILHFGVGVLSLDGTRPDDSKSMAWGRFDGWGRVKWQAVDQARLLELLRFEIEPDSFAPMRFGRDARGGAVVVSRSDQQGGICE